DELRAEILGIWGVGPETADSILLYALNRRSFVIDAYTMRVLHRHGLARAGTTYESAREFLAARVPQSVSDYNEFHALMVWVGKHYCKPSPRCASCPLSRRSCFASEKSWSAMAKYRRPAGA
ncbi:hypothetical protein HY256_08570, partial [Candidatus Sumerlaeota bacterium]|nr:hypothetical protein [Candidatus Sumerlaeota bacterium]